MPGFIAEIAKDRLLGNFGTTRMENRVIGLLTDNKSFCVERRTINKFMNDKVFYEDENYIVVTEGAILNSLALQEKYLGSSKSDAKNFVSAIIEMYKKNGEQFFNEFRGSFSGIFYDKKDDLWLIYTNHIGNKQLFYTQTPYGWAFASEITWLADYLKHNGLEYTLDENGAYFLLTYGYMIEDYTLFNEIKKIRAGKYIRIRNRKLSVRQYHRFNNEPNESQPESEIIEAMDRLFRNAVKLEWDKDVEYGYKHCASLSGGLDSRMNVWVAHDMGYTDQLNWTMSESDYLDERIAKQIARDLRHDFLFKALDNGKYLCGIIDDIIELQFGTVFFAGSAHKRSFKMMLNSKEYGLEHSGQLGDAVLGTYLNSTGRGADGNYLGEGAYSHILLDKLTKVKLADRYDNFELFKFYNRGFNGILQGDMIDQENTEVASPFLDIEFMEYCLHIPAQTRSDHNIYIKWILKKYPEAAKYKWQSINARITNKLAIKCNRKISIKGHLLLLKDIPKVAINKICPFTNRPNRKESMNPLNFWYNTNLQLKAYMDDYFKTFLPLCKSDALRNDIKKIYTEGRIYEKLLSLTLLGAIKKYKL